MKTIDTLVTDIYTLLDKGRSFPRDAFEVYGQEQEAILEHRVGVGGEKKGRLRLSSVGKPCVRQLWYELYAPLHGEPLRPATRLKFLYGDLVEAMLLELARKSGHVVAGEQELIYVNGVEGHRDCVIDGMLVDVKSASPFSFTKFKGGLQREQDAFGYLTQLGSYLLGSKDDPLVTYKNEAAFLVMDKVSGAIHLDRHTYTEEDFDKISTVIETRKAVLRNQEEPDREFEDTPEGKSGNRKLGVNCSYCPFKTHCFPDLRTFVYAGNRPVFLTHVEREPNVPEVKRD